MNIKLIPGDAMTFVDHIADATDIRDVFELVNEFVGALDYANEIREIPVGLRPGPIDTADALSYWLSLISDEIKRRDSIQETTPDCMFAMHAVLETAVQKVCGGWQSPRFR